MLYNNRRIFVRAALVSVFLFLNLLPVSSVFAYSKTGYDKVLSGYDYPYPVDTFEVESQGQEMNMVYMDIDPRGVERGTILLLHGKNFSGAYWKTTIEALTDDGYRVIAPDQVGFGKSTKPDCYQFSFQTLARNTMELLGHIGVREVTVAGHSMGGMLAVRFALMYPDFVNGLVLVNPIGLEDWKRKVPAVAIDDWLAQELKKTPEGVRSYMKKNYFDGVWKDAYDPLVEIQAGWINGPDYDLIAWNSALAYDMICTQPVVYEFPDISIPTLLIIGQRDRTALGKNLVEPEVAATMGRYPELGRKAADAIPDARLVELDNIGHVPQFEAFDTYISAFREFLTGLP